ncbi:MAG: insulinase family protein [Chlorobi bacterium]|nr:insulinase family protein [Chlorobiota bacterium]
MRKRTTPLFRTPSVSHAPECTVLPNGMRIVTDTVPHARSFALGIWITCGSRNDTIPGIAHMVEHVLFRRSQRYSGMERAHRVESLGAYMNASTSKELTWYYVRGLAEHFEPLADMLVELVYAPRLTKRDVQTERRIIVEEIRSYDDDPEEVVCDVLDTLLFGTHPLSHPITGTVETVERITLEDIESFHRAWYTGVSSAIVVSGPFEHSSVVECIERIIARWQIPQGIDNHAVSPSPPLLPPQQKVIQRSFQQVHCAFGIRTSGAQSPDRHALAMLNVLLGDSVSSRLYRRLRERRGLAYTVYSSLQLFSDCGELVLYAGTRPDKLDTTVAAIVEEIERLQTIPPTTAEFRRAREQVRASLVMSTESLSARMHAIARMLLEERSLEPLDAIVAAIERTTIEQLHTVAAQLSTPEAWSRVLCTG